MDTMSWFDATGFANLAKSALKEAQKTIDKALDINEEEERRSQMTLKDAVPRSESEPELSTTNKLGQTSSLWGSFTGSFFENPMTHGEESGGKEVLSRPTNLISNQPKKSTTFHQQQSSLIEDLHPQESPTTDGEPISPANIREELQTFPPVVYRKKEPRNYNNRLSVISSESDRRSSSSFEVLGSCTPDSEVPASLSTSSSVARLRQSGSFESVEVLTSPSSVEVITSPSIEQKYSSDSISPVLEGDGDELSLAEDSYTETLTCGTVLETVKDVMLKSTSSLDTSLNEPIKEGGNSDCAASSCEEGTLMASSGEETSMHTVTTTSFLKNMLADAMTEHREHSSISSESRSDMIKVGLGSSGHTSGDELETTTSSDIEIISSPTPNGDSSSTASRQSPARLCIRNKLSLADSSSLHTVSKPSFITKGHQRELSEGSSGGSDEASEVDKLLKRMSEMTEILEVREAKLIDLSRVNSELQEANNHLQSQLESGQQKQDISELSEEFTQRLAALERKFQQAIREKDILRKQLEQSKVTAALAEESAEKDQVIKDLRTEGEKLSKQQLTLNNIIKKLRATEKENQKTISSLKEQLEEYSQEVERSKKALSAKQDVERSQIEAVHQLTKANQRLENQVSSLTTHQESLTSTIVSLQKEVTASKEQCSQLQTRLTEVKMEVEAEVQTRLEAEWGETAEQRDQLEATVQQLREKLDQQLEQHDKQVQELRNEQTELVRRLEAAGAAAENAVQSVSAATQPLVRQIDAITSSHHQAQANWERQERRLLQQIAELGSRVATLVEADCSMRDTLVASNSRCSSLESQLASVHRDLESTQAQLRDTIQSMQLNEDQQNRVEEELRETVRKLNLELEDCERVRGGLEQNLSVERAAVEAERRKVAAIQEQTKICRGSSPLNTPCSSPTLSVGRLSLADSMASNLWSNYAEEVETGSGSGRMPVVYGNTTSVLESLQSQLKQREGEVHQLQWELSRREVERAALSNDLATLTARVEVQDKRLAELNSLQTEYDALLLLYGEKLEESQELRMDLQDVKDMYKAQIEQLLEKEKSS